MRELLREYKAMKNNLKMLKGNRGGIRKLMRAQFRNGNFSLDDIIKGTESS